MTDRAAITFLAGDEPLVRAEKIWRAVGMANDPYGMVAQMVAVLSRCVGSANQNQQVACFPNIAGLLRKPHPWG